MTPSYHTFLKTIPVPGKQLTRDPETLKKLVDGKPFKPTNWNISPNPSPILLANTGESHIIGIDFDGPEGESNFHKALDIDPGCAYIAKGVGKGGGHFIYKSSNASYLHDVVTNPNGFNIGGLDLQMGRKLLLLATPANTTKHLLTDPIQRYEDLTEMPLAMQAFVASIYLRNKQKEAIVTQGMDSTVHRDSKLYYIVNEALNNPGHYNHKLFNIITTKEYKSLLAKEPKHESMPFIPDNLPLDESGNKYLVSIATILGRDPSIDAELFVKAMDYVNSLFSEPYDKDGLNSIITYITSGNSQIDGTPVWQYNRDWNKQGMIYTDNLDASHEVFSYNNKGTIGYIDHNHITNEVEYFTSSGALLDNIKATSSRNSKMNKEKLLSRVQKVKLISTPLIAFGVNRKEFGHEFNTYKRSDEQEILMNPDIYKDYQYPDVTIRFLENSMGAERLHKFFLPFIRRKLTTRQFSPLIMVLWGPPHSGKSAVTNGILRPLTKGRNITLSPEIATEKYDDWKLNKDVVLVDEVHNTRSDILQKMVQTMNTISGSDIFTGVRAMQASASSDEHPNTITLFATCNKVVTLSTEPQDRRLVVLRSNKTAAAALEMSNDRIHQAIVAESKDFAYYLATEVKDLPEHRYVTNDWLKDAVYEEFQSSALPFTISFPTAINNNDFKAFEEILMDFHITLDDIAHSSCIVKHQVQIRLFNSNEQEAYYPALLGNVNIDSKKLIKELKEIENTMVRRVDIKNGARSMNKKTLAMFNIDNVPDELIDKINSVEKMEPIQQGKTDEN